MFPMGHQQLNTSLWQWFKSSWVTSHNGSFFHQKVSSLVNSCSNDSDKMFFNAYCYKMFRSFFQIMWYCDVLCLGSTLLPSHEQHIFVYTIHDDLTDFTTAQQGVITFIDKAS